MTLKGTFHKVYQSCCKLYFRDLSFIKLKYSAFSHSIQPKYSGKKIEDVRLLGYSIAREALFFSCRQVSIMKIVADRNNLALTIIAVVMNKTIVSLNYFFLFLVEIKTEVKIHERKFVGNAELLYGSHLAMTHYLRVFFSS